MSADCSVRVVFTKWAGRRHWEFDAIRLGEDEHGVWLGVPVGCVFSSPMGEFACDRANAMLIPAGRPWTAQFWSRSLPENPAEIVVYVDITTPPSWEGGEVTMIDLDLDVVRRADGTVFVDDEDEFADNAKRFAYPAATVALAEGACADALTAVRSGVEPFGEVGIAWLARAAVLEPVRP